jgi:hypothetical protein
LVPPSTPPTFTALLPPITKAQRPNRKSPVVLRLKSCRVVVVEAEGSPFDGLP